jgi:hypothetical protein
MTITAVKLASGVGTGSAVSVYTVPAATTVVIKQANFTNTTGGARSRAPRACRRT